MAWVAGRHRWRMVVVVAVLPSLARPGCCKDVHADPPRVARPRYRSISGLRTQAHLPPPPPRRACYCCCCCCCSCCCCCHLHQCGVSAGAGQRHANGMRRSPRLVKRGGQRCRRRTHASSVCCATAACVQQIKAQQMDGPDGAPPAADAAAAAAARRARILARGQDRLASISGAAAGTKRPPSSACNGLACGQGAAWTHHGAQAACAHAHAGAAPVQPPSHHAQGQAGCEQAAAGVQGQQPPAQEAVRAEPSGARPSPGGAAAVLEAVPVASTSRGVQGASAECMPPPVASQLRSRSTAAAAAAEAQRATSPASTSWAGAAGGGVGGSVDGVGDDGAVAGCAAPAAPAQAPLPPCKWAALNASVRVSRLLRYLAVLWYARALAQGQWALLPPVVVVVATQVSGASVRACVRPRGACVPALQLPAV